jgi:hypothetical protein
VSHRVFKLKKPIKVGETTEPVTELKLREEVCAGDLRGIKLSSLQDPMTDDLLKIAARLSGQTELVINKLGLEDMGEVLAAVVDFLGAGQGTGTTA